MNMPKNANKKLFFAQSLRFKAVVLMALAVAGIALGSGFYFSSNATKLVFEAALEKMDTVGETFSFNAEYGLLLKDEHILSKIVKGVALQESVLSAAILDPEGNVMAKESKAGHSISLETFFSKIAKLEAVKIKEKRAGREVYVLSYPVFTQSQKGSKELSLFGEENIAAEIIGYAVILFSPSAIYSKIHKIQVGISIYLVIFFFLIMAVVFFITHFFIQQLRRLLAATLKIGQGDLTARVLGYSSDELGELSEGFNQMAKTLEETTVGRDALAKEMTERKRLEKVILQSEKMAAVGQLAGGVAHEINNPLGVILGFAQNLCKRMPPGDPLEMPLKSIEREAIRCKNLVQDLLTFSRAGKTEREPIDVKDAIDSALSLVLAYSKVKNVELIKDFTVDLPKVMGSRNQLQQIIVNLSNNAMDAMPEGGQLRIRTLNAQLEGKDYIEIRVSDTGKGIPPEIRSKVFDPFFTTKDVGKGTGLGLSLVFEIVQKHEGMILLESEVGKGTTFKVFLPVVKKTL